MVRAEQSAAAASSTSRFGVETQDAKRKSFAKQKSRLETPIPACKHMLSRETNDPRRSPRPFLRWTPATPLLAFRAGSTDPALTEHSRRATAKRASATSDTNCNSRWKEPP